MPLLEHPMFRALRSNGQAIKLPRQADREIANINHLLHFACAFSDDLSGLQRYQPPEVRFGLAQGVAQLAHDVPALGSGDVLPLSKRLLGALDGAFVLRRRGGADGGESLAINWRYAFEQFATAQPFAAKCAGV